MQSLSAPRRNRLLLSLFVLVTPFFGLGPLVHRVYAEMPQAIHGHMGASNHAYTGWWVKGNGTGFAEFNPPRNCPVQSETDGTVSCFTDFVTSSAAKPVYFGFTIEGKPTAAGIWRFKIPIAAGITCPDDFAGSYVTAKAASSSSVAFTIKKNASTVGTATFATSADATLVTSGGATTFALGDAIEFDAPSPQNSTLSSVGITLACTTP